MSKHQEQPRSNNRLWGALGLFVFLLCLCAVSLLAGSVIMDKAAEIAASRDRRIENTEAQYTIRAIADEAIRALSDAAAGDRALAAQAMAQRDGSAASVTAGLQPDSSMWWWQLCGAIIGCVLLVIVGKLLLRRG